MPAAWEEFTADELAHVLAESRGRAEDLLTLAPRAGEQAARHQGGVAGRDRARRSKAEIIAWATALLDPDEARAAEAMVLGRAGRLTPGGLRAAIARAVMDVAPDKARKRREEAARDARVQRWAEDSGNAALMGRELPPAEVLAADQRITAWARQLKRAGLEGDMDVLRARAYLDLLLGKDSRPRQDAGERGGRRRAAGSARRWPGQDHQTRASPPAGPGRRGAGRVRRAGQPDRPAGAPCWIWPSGPGRSPASGRSTRIPKQIHRIVTKPGISRPRYPAHQRIDRTEETCGLSLRSSNRRLCPLSCRQQAGQLSALMDLLLNSPKRQPRPRVVTQCDKCSARARRRPRLRASKPIRHEPVKAHMLFGSFTDKATVNLCRDTHHEPA